MNGERGVPEDALVELAGSAGSTPPVCEREVVEDEQFIGGQADLDHGGLQAHVSLREERGLVGQGGELLAEAVRY